MRKNKTILDDSTLIPTKAEPELIWRDESNLQIDGVHYLLTCDPGIYQREHATPGSFILVKGKHMVLWACDIARHHRTEKIFEMGILHGGSVALNEQIFNPSRLLAIDLNPVPVRALTEHIAGRDKAEVIRPRYGVSQADRPSIEALLDAEFPHRDIDLILDDASHLYDETRAAFNISFPYLAPGGLYVIEDWAWAHWEGEYWQGEYSPFLEAQSSRVRRWLRLPEKPNKYFPLRGKPALSNLLVELFILSASRPDLVENVLVDHNMVIVRKGPSAVTPARFDIADHCLLRGKKFKAWL